ncbi:hypothetical protein HPB52_011310 [Rhipicephalus sanguineus]|uniref:CCHC-type domain-containing protein n=1 Tax=Rhipicephalus sanguineus TaxID=34632 RepID=A0A9D4Q8W1_RHISA|nr:hypothetical protein HPB52_011310 [Rhipicephalus sanguineus]
MPNIPDVRHYDDLDDQRLEWLEVTFPEYMENLKKQATHARGFLTTETYEALLLTTDINKKKGTGCGKITWPYYWEINRFLQALPMNDASLLQETACSDSSAVEQIIRDMEMGSTCEQEDDALGDDKISVQVTDPTATQETEASASPTEGTSSAEIVAGLRVDSRYTVLGARMLGRSSSAVITFDGPHVPYYITYQSGDYRCKPYRKSVQYCRKCGAIGHRQGHCHGLGHCPRPREDFCYKCGQGAVTEDHDCLPKCKICGKAHETAGKECKKKLRRNPPPYQVRQ